MPPRRPAGQTTVATTTRRHASSTATTRGIRRTRGRSNPDEAPAGAAPSAAPDTGPGIGKRCEGGVLRCFASTVRARAAVPDRVIDASPEPSLPTPAALLVGIGPPGGRHRQIPTVRIVSRQRPNQSSSRRSESRNRRSSRCSSPHGPIGTLVRRGLIGRAHGHGIKSERPGTVNRRREADRRGQVPENIPDRCLELRSGRSVGHGRRVGRSGVGGLRQLQIDLNLVLARCRSWWRGGF